MILILTKLIITVFTLIIFISTTGSFFKTKYKNNKLLTSISIIIAVMSTFTTVSFSIDIAKNEIISTLSDKQLSSNIKQNSADQDKLAKEKIKSINSNKKDIIIKKKKTENLSLESTHLTEATNQKKDIIERKVVKKTKLVSEENSPIYTGVSKNRKTDRYAILLLTTGSKSKANKIMQSMLAEGYPTYIRIVINSGVKYRVNVGDYESNEEAASVQARMKRRYSSNSEVQNSIVVYSTK